MRATLSWAANIWTVTLNYYENSSTILNIPPEHSGTWRFYTGSLPDVVTPTITSNAPLATLNPAPTNSIDTLTSTDIYHHKLIGTIDTYAYATSNPSVSVSFTGSGNDTAPDTCPVSSFAWSTGATSLGTGVATTPSAPFAKGASGSVYVIDFAAIEDFANAACTGRTVHDYVTVVVKDPPAARFEYSTDGGTTYQSYASGYIFLKGGGPLYVRDSVASPSVSNDPQGVGIDRYSWYFGAGAAVETASANYTYGAVPTVYSASFTIYDQYGCETVVPFQVVVVNDPSVSIQYKTTSGGAYSAPPVPPLSPVHARLGIDPDNAANALCFKLFFQAAGASDGFPAAFGGPKAVSYEWTFDTGVDPVATGTTSIHKYLEAKETIAQVKISVSSGTAYVNSFTSSMPVWVLGSELEKVSFPKPQWYNPIIDGSVYLDQNWNGAHAVTYGNGTTPYGAFQALTGISSNNYLYMSFEVDYDTISSGDAVVIALRANNSNPDIGGYTANDNRLIVINLNPADTANPAYTLWKQTGTSWGACTPTSQATEFTVKSSTRNDGTNDYWYVELKIPTTTAVTGSEWIAITSPFLFYFDILKDVGTIDPSLHWPLQTAVVSNPDPALPNAFLSPLWWGEASIGVNLSKGLRVTSANTDNVNLESSCNPDDRNTYMSLGKANTFYAMVENTNEVNGVHKPVTGVKVRFRIANWGIGSLTAWESFTPDAGSSNPAGPLLVDTTLEFSSVWTPLTDYSEGGTCDPTTNTWAGHCHQCIMSEIESADKAVIVQKSIFTNMDFVNVWKTCFGGGGGGGSGSGAGTGNGSDEDKAVVDTEGMDAPPAGEKKQTILLKVVKKQFVIKEKNDDPIIKRLLRLDPAMKLFVTDDVMTVKPKSEKDGKGAVEKFAPITLENNVYYMSYEIYGLRATGKKMTVKGKTFDVYQNVGSFGKLLRSDQRVDEWQFDIQGAEKVGENLYQMKVNAGERGYVTVKAKAAQHNFALSLHGGLVTPFIAMGSSYTSGFCVMLDAEYKFLPFLSAIFLAGYNSFPSASTSGTGTSIVNLSLGARGTLDIVSWLYVYGQLCGTLYIHDFANFGVGFNVGAGVGVNLSPQFSLELGEDYYFANEQRMFFQTHLGIILRL